MAQHALDPAYRRVEVDEFLAMDFGGARAELEDGVIQMMAGSNEMHSRIAANIIMSLGPKLRGTGCRPYGSDLGVRTEDRTVRLSDGSIYCNDPARPENAFKQLIGDPQVVFEVLSRSTSSHDQIDKLAEYRELAGIREIVFVDPQTERVRLVTRTQRGGWSDEWLDARKGVPLSSLGLTIPHADLFATD